MDSEWGRIAEDGTAYVRTAEGERVIGSWQAGTAAEGIAYYTRRYDELAADVTLLEGRAASSASDPKAVEESTRKLRASLEDAAVIGDLAALGQRLDAIGVVLERRRAQRTAARAEAAARAADAKRALVTEAEQLADSTDWRSAGERFRAIVDEWKAIKGVERRIDGELWERFAAARKQFESRRRSNLAERDRERAAAGQRKEALVRDAEKLSGSTDWGPTAKAYRDLMTAWKAAGRTTREVEDELWGRFKTAQDSFFTARSAVFAERDATLAANLAAKQALLEEAESLDPNADPTGAQKRLGSIHDRWDKIGRIPREQVSRLDDRLATVERRIRGAASAARQVTVTESPIVIRLRESVGKLEARLQRAREAGDDKLATETETSLATQREWLTQAEAASDG